MNLIPKNRIINNTQSVKNQNNSKKYIFLNIHLEILEKNKEKDNSNLKKISNCRFSSYISKKEIEYQRLLKVSWFIKIKYDEHIKSKNLKTYHLKDIVNGVNSMIIKDNQKPVTKRTMQKDIKKLIKMNLMASFSKSLGKDNGGFSFYKINTDIWQNRIEILRNYIENEIKEYAKNKIIVSIFKDAIDNLVFSSSSLSTSPLSNSTLIYKYIKDKNKINKNSNELTFNEKKIKNNLKIKLIKKEKNLKEIELEKKEKEIKNENDAVIKAKKKKAIKEQEHDHLKNLNLSNVVDISLKIKLKQTIGYLKSKFKIDDEIILKAKNLFKENYLSLKNCLLNLKNFVSDSINKEISSSVNQIALFFLSEVEVKYTNKIHLTSKYHKEKGLKSDYYDILDKFEYEVNRNIEIEKEKERISNRILSKEYLKTYLRSEIQSDSNFGISIYDPQDVFELIDDKFLNLNPKLTASEFKNQENQLIEFLKKEISKCLVKKETKNE